MSLELELGRAPDYLSACSATGKRNPVLEEIHERSSEVLLAVFRLVKIALVHALDNDAVKSTLELSHDVLTSFADSVGQPASITYAQENVFVCGELLRASRSVYDSSIELGALLGRCGVSEVSFLPGLRYEELLAFAEAASASIRDPGRRHHLLEAHLSRVLVRAVDTTLVKRQDEQELSLKDRALNTYATALLVVQQLHDALASGSTNLPYRLKRVAQRLVVIAEEVEPTLLGLTTLTHAHRDDVVRAVHSAILALVVARQITRDRTVLARLVMTALQADAGRIHAASRSHAAPLARLSDEEERAIPAIAGAVAFVTGGVNVASALRAVTSFETSWLEREDLLGPTYWGELTPTLQAEILRLARRLLDLVAPRSAAEALSPFQALAALAAEPWVDSTQLRLVVCALGFLPPGTVVELGDGRWGVVTGPSGSDATTLLPRLRVLTDRDGRAMTEEVHIDLGQAQSVGPESRVARVITPDRTRFNVTRAFFE